MLFIIEAIDLAGIFDSDFQGIQINFAPPRRICQFSQGGAGQDMLFCGVWRGAYPWLDTSVMTNDWLEVTDSMTDPLTQSSREDKNLIFAITLFLVLSLSLWRAGWHSFLPVELYLWHKTDKPEPREDLHVFDNKLWYQGSFAKFALWWCVLTDASKQRWVYNTNEYAKLYLQNVFVQVAKCSCPNYHLYCSVSGNDPLSLVTDVLLKPAAASYCCLALLLNP